MNTSTYSVLKVRVGTVTLHDQVASVSQTSLYLFFSLTQLVVILSIRNRDHFWKAVAPSRPLMGAVALTGVIALAIPYIQPIEQLFSFSPLPPAEVGVIVLLAMLYLVVLDVVMVLYYRVWRARGQAPGRPSHMTSAGDHRLGIGLLWAASAPVHRWGASIRRTAAYIYDFAEGLGT